jgi:DNA-binding transcriptional regulator YdaS (Cro superfamily)
MKTSDNPITDAIACAGSAQKLGTLLGVTGRAVLKWQAAWNDGRQPALRDVRAIQIEQVVGIPRHRLRPDLWSPPSREAA